MYNIEIHDVDRFKCKKVTFLLKWNNIHIGNGAVSRSYNDVTGYTDRISWQLIHFSSIDIYIYIYIYIYIIYIIDI